MKLFWGMGLFLIPFITFADFKIESKGRLKAVIWSEYKVGDKESKLFFVRCAPNTPDAELNRKCKSLPNRTSHEVWTWVSDFARMAQSERFTLRKLSTEIEDMVDVILARAEEPMNVANKAVSGRDPVATLALNVFDRVEGQFIVQDIKKKQEAEDLAAKVAEEEAAKKEALRPYHVVAKGSCKIIGRQPQNMNGRGTRWVTMTVVGESKGLTRQQAEAAALLDCEQRMNTKEFALKRLYVFEVVQKCEVVSAKAM